MQQEPPDKQATSPDAVGIFAALMGLCFYLLGGTTMLLAVVATGVVTMFFIIAMASSKPSPWWMTWVRVLVWLTSLGIAVAAFSEGVDSILLF